MNIAQITTTLEGGAGIAAIRASEALSYIGEESSLIFDRQKYRSAVLRSKITTVLQQKMVQSGSNLVTTFSTTSIDIESLRNFQVLHFHSIYNLLSTKRIDEIAKERPVFVTLHDQRLLTGGCHYSDGCLNFLSECSNCPQTRKQFWKYVEKEKSNVSSLLLNPQVHLVSPSIWLANMAQQVTHGKKKIHVIRNAIPEMLLISKETAKKNLGIPLDKFVIGFVSVNLNNPLKGMQDLISALEILPLQTQKQIHLLLVGKTKVNIDHIPISKTFIQGELASGIENRYSPMDLLVVPSREDNSPNVIGEAFMSGVRVLGSKVGGIPELVGEFACASINTAEPIIFANQILQEIEKEYSRENIASKARKIFGYRSFGNALKKVYVDVI